MRKGPLIAAGIIALIGLIMTTIGGIFYVLLWGQWLLWIGLIFVNISLIVLVNTQKKPPKNKEAIEQTETV